MLVGQKVGRNHGKDDTKSFSFFIFQFLRCNDGGKEAFMIQIGKFHRQGGIGSEGAKGKQGLLLPLSLCLYPLQLLHVSEER